MFMNWPFFGLVCRGHSWNWFQLNCIFNQEPKRTHKTKKSHEQRQRIFWTIRGGYRPLPSKTRVLRQIAPESSPERSAKSLSHSFFVAPFLSPIQVSGNVNQLVFKQRIAVMGHGTSTHDDHLLFNFGTPSVRGGNGLMICLAVSVCALPSPSVLVNVVDKAALHRQKMEGPQLGGQRYSTCIP